MFIEVYEDDNNITKKVSIINADYIKRFFIMPDKDDIMYAPKIETKDKKVYCIDENMCRNEAMYVIDNIICQIKNSSDKNNKIVPYKLRYFYEKNTFISYYDKGLIKNNEQLDLLIEQALKQLKNDGEEYDNLKLFTKAREKASSDQFKLLQDAFAEYRKNIEMLNPILSEYLL